MLTSLQLQSYLERLFPINRSLTGKGNVQSLEILKEIIPQLEVKSVKSGTKTFDWEIPKEWNVSSAFIQRLNGEKILDFKENNLHLVQYSKAFSGLISRKELFEHLHTSDKLSNAIPYVTAYYDDYWGFCVSEDVKNKMLDEEYFVEIIANKEKGRMHFGELLVKGASKQEIIISTYICHPSMANNELSGPLVSISLAHELLLRRESLYFSYRFIFVPETIGAIYFISKNFKNLKRYAKAVFVLTCIGDNRNWSFLKSKSENTLPDKVVRFAFEQNSIQYKEYSYLDRGSDERQFGAPKVNLPVVSIMRSKYGTFDEYHTSADNLNLVNGENLFESCNFMIHVVDILEKNVIPVATVFCEPFFKKRNLRELGFQNTSLKAKDSKLTNFLAFCDGEHDLIDISRKVKIDFYECHELMKILLSEELIQIAS